MYISGEFLDKHNGIQMSYGCNSYYDEYGQLITKITVTNKITLETQDIIQEEIKVTKFSIFREMHKSSIFCATDVKNCDYLFVVDFATDRIASFNLTPQQFCDDLNACLNGVGSITKKILMRRANIESRTPETFIYIFDRHYENLVGAENIICMTSAQQINSPIPHIEPPSSAKRTRDDEDQTTDNKRQKQ